MYCDLLSGDSILAKCFTGWYEAVPMLVIISPSGRPSTVPFTNILYFLAVS